MRRACTRISFVTNGCTVACFLCYSHLFCDNCSDFTKHQSELCSVTALRKGNCAFSFPYTVPVVTYQNTGEDRNEKTNLQNANAVCFGNFQGECYSFGEVLLFIRGIRISSEKRLFPSTSLSVCPSAYIGADPTHRFL